MASACVNNVAVTTPPKFSSYACLTPRVSVTRDDAKRKPNANVDDDDNTDLEEEVSDFEFRLDDPVAMLPADELISDGKLMPMMMQLPVAKQPSAPETRLITEVLSSRADPYLFSPKAPRCASRWKELFGLKKSSLSLNNSEPKSGSASNKSLKNLLRRNSKSSSSSDAAGGTLSLPLLRDSECESLSVSSSRLSLSSSSSGHELEDFPRLSLDADKHNINPISLLKSVANYNPPSRLRLQQVKPRPPEKVGTRMGRTATEQAAAAATAASYVDSPRMNPSGKIVFHSSLERSSSSPSSFNGGPRFKHSGMERSYSANVRVTPVLNVPVCSLSKSGSVLGFGQLFSSQQRRDFSCGSSRSYQSINNSNINTRT